MIYEGEKELDKQEIFTLREVTKELLAGQSNYRKQIATLTKERDALREALSLLINFVPGGWEMPLGYGQAIAQARDILLTHTI